MIQRPNLIDADPLVWRSLNVGNQAAQGFLPHFLVEAISVADDECQAGRIDVRFGGALGRFDEVVPRESVNGESDDGFIVVCLLLKIRCGPRSRIEVDFTDRLDRILDERFTFICVRAVHVSKGIVRLLEVILGRNEARRRAWEGSREGMACESVPLQRLTVRSYGKGCDWCLVICRWNEKREERHDL